MGRHDEAISAFERTAALNPNFVTGRFGLALVYAGDPARAIEVLATYRRFEPFYPASPAGFLGLAYHMLKKYEDAMAPLLECPRGRPTFDPVTAGWQPTMCDSESSVRPGERLLRPYASANFTIAQQRHLMKFKRSKDAEHFFGNLRQAGLPEN